MLAMALKIKDNRNFVGFGMLRKTDIKHSAFLSVFCFFFFFGCQFHPNVELELLEGSIEHR